MNLNENVVYRCCRLRPLGQFHPGRSRSLFGYYDCLHVNISIKVVPGVKPFPKPLRNGPCDRIAFRSSRAGVTAGKSSSGSNTLLRKFFLEYMATQRDDLYDVRFPIAAPSLAASRPLQQRSEALWYYIGIGQLAADDEGNGRVGNRGWFKAIGRSQAFPSGERCCHHNRRPASRRL
jgi:hypothetical protein